MAKKIATEQYAYNIGVGKGTPTSNLMVTYSRAVALGCQIRYNTYSSSQLVRQEDLWSCSCQGATGAYNDCGSNCSCNTCNSNTAYQTSCSCNTCNTNNTYSTSCSCNTCNTNKTYSTSCSCNTCNTNNTYSTSCSCNTCNTNNSYSTTCSTNKVYCTCNTQSNKTGSCTCNSNVTPTSKGCSCVYGVNKYCASNKVFGCINGFCGGYGATGIPPYINYECSSNTYYKSCSSDTCSAADYSYSVCSRHQYSMCGSDIDYGYKGATSVSCGTHSCSSNGACPSVACSCNSCNSDTKCSSKTVSCPSNCPSHTNSANCGSGNTVSKACTCHNNASTCSSKGTCSCHGNTSTCSSKGSCTCHSNTSTCSTKGTCSCYNNTNPCSTKGSCTCYNNTPCSCNGNWVTCQQKNYKEGTNS